MHILLTDVLTCPRCGPRFGLILLAERSGNRRILEGSLGCANCREKYPVQDGVVRFADIPPSPMADADPDEAMRLAALMGVAGGPANVLLCGPAASHAAAVATLLEHVEVIAVTTTADAPTPAAADEPSGSEPEAAQHVSRLTVARALPLATGRMAAAVLSGPAADALLDEGARVVSPVGRLVLLDAPDDAESRLRAAGFRRFTSEGRTIVAARH